jgi:hypothetical protein
MDESLKAVLQKESENYNSSSEMMDNISFISGL